MKIIKVGHKDIQIELSAVELMIAKNALNEICHGVKIVGLESRIGAEKIEIV